MRNFANIFTIVCFSLFYYQAKAQKKITIISDGVRIEHELILEDKDIFENIVVTNTLDSTIYIPRINNKELYFFVLNEILYSYCGIMASLLGHPNLNSEVDLIELLPQKKYDFKVKINNINKSSKINKYIYSVDYVKNNKFLKKDSNGEIYMKMTDYVNEKKYSIMELKNF